MTHSALSHLECSTTGARHDAGVLQTVSNPAGETLLARYDLKEVAATPAEIAARPRGMWRWIELLPDPGPAGPVTLGEGDTPLIPLETGSASGLRVLVKDESLNPTGSFKARGMSAAVTRARALGATELAAPSAGNAAVALAAYTARAGLKAHVAIPRDTPPGIAHSCYLLGAEVTLVDGLIDDAGRLIRELAPQSGWFDVSTLREPYRVEGKKTMALEVLEALGWKYPEAVIYPTGGGTGLVGMWKAFGEAEALGWISGRRPRLYSVQAEGCAPIVRAFLQRTPRAQPWTGANTAAWGLRVPAAIGDHLILTALRESGGGALSVSEDEWRQGRRALCHLGFMAGPESGAAMAALGRLRAEGAVRNDELVILFHTGSDLPYRSPLP
jgi:threonine synthase